MATEAQELQTIKVEVQLETEEEEIKPASSGSEEQSLAIEHEDQPNILQGALDHKRDYHCKL